MTEKKATHLTFPLTEEKTKELLTEILIEMMESKREIFYEIVIEALEDIGLGQAIAEGRKNDFVSEEEIFSILDGKEE